MKNKLFIIALCSIFMINFIFAPLRIEAETVTVDGESTRYITGDSFARDITVSGYDVRNDNFYTNFTLETTKAVAGGQVVTFNYYIEIYDNTGALIGNLGSLAAPQSKSALAGSQTVNVVNEIVPMMSDLTAEYRMVVTVATSPVV